MNIEKVFILITSKKFGFLAFLKMKYWFSIKWVSFEFLNTFHGFLNPFTSINISPKIIYFLTLENKNLSYLKKLNWTTNKKYFSSIVKKSASTHPLLLEFYEMKI